MRCPSCQHENPERAKFCLECAAPFGQPCSSCGTELPAAAKFCLECAQPVASTASGPPERKLAAYTPKHLAEKILQSKSALEGERKQVTVLFADVKGSMALAQQVDPEAWHAILDRFFLILAEGVHRFEGTVNQYTGDGIMALFGAPIAHEDHAQRACYAVLHLREQLASYADELRRTRGLNFSVRMGVNSGEVVVGKIGDDLRMDYTAQGHSVGLAQRIEQLAPPGTAYLTHQTARLVEGFFQLRDLGEFQLPGVAEPLSVFELEGAGKLRTRLDVSRSRGFAKFVGRDAEMAALEAALERSLAGNGQVVGVVAEAGAGKSRLCFEFLERCRARGLPIFEAHGVAHGNAVPFQPIRELQRSFYGIAEQDSPATARDKVAGRLLLLDESLRDYLPVLFDFLGVADPDQPAPPTDPEARQRQLQAISQRAVQALRGTRVTLLEDLHWFDEGSDSFVAHIVEGVYAAGTLLILNFRPEYHASWMQRSNYQQLPLVPLGPEAIRELLDELLGNDASVQALPELIQEQTAGNPFFIEEVVRSLVESGHLEGAAGSYRLVTGIAQLPVPESVHAVLAARIDRLAEREKQVLQTASVIGKDFLEPVLGAVVELPDVQLIESLSRLRAGEFLFEQALYPVAEYAFKHPLTQEVAYSSQLQERRARIHHAVARALQDYFAEALDERAGLLAHHWERAGEAMEAARWHCRSAQWAGIATVRDELEHWQRARALLADLKPTPETTSLGLEAGVRILSLAYRVGQSAVPLEETTAVYEEGRLRAEQSSDTRSLARLHALYGAVRDVRFNDVAGHLRLAQQAVALAAKTDDIETLLDVLVGQVGALQQAGRLAEALGDADRALELVAGNARWRSDLWGFDTALYFATARAWLLNWMGRLQEADDELEQVERSARAHGGPLDLAQVGDFRAHNAQLRGDVPVALARAEAALERQDQLKGTFALSTAYGRLGRAYLLAGRLDDAAKAFERWALDASEHGLSDNTLSVHKAAQAETYRRRGELDRALATARESITVAGLQFPIWRLEAQLSLARVLLQTEGPRCEELAQTLASTEALIESTGARVFAPPLHEIKAGRADLLGEPEVRARELREAQRLFTEMGATGHAERVARELGILSPEFSS